jgi:hypothetical protein
MNQFAANLKAQIVERDPEAAAAAARPSPTGPAQPPPAAGRPISGLSLIAKVIWNAVMSLFRRTG